MNKFSKILQITWVTMIMVFTSQFARAGENGPMVDGEIREIRPSGELTLKHGPIPNLDMGAMVMVFKVKDAKLAKGLKVGDKIKFHAEDIDGKLTIMQLNKAQ